MQKMNATLLSALLVLIGLIVLLLCIFGLPNLARETVMHSPEVAYLQYPVLLGMYATAIPFFYAIYEAVVIIRTAERESIFSEEILQSLSRIKYCGFSIIALYVAGFCLLDIANALPPLVALLGVAIMLLTAVVITASIFIRNVLSKSVAST